MNLFALRKSISPLVFQVMAVASFFAAFGIYWLISVIDATPFVPSPGELYEGARGILKSDYLWIDFKFSFLRITGGFLAAAFVAVPLGMLVGAFRFFEAWLQPLTEFGRYVPVPALIPLLMTFFGIGETPKVMLIFIGVFFQLLLMVADEVRRVPYELLQVSYTLGARRLEAIGQVLFRASLPGIFDALRLCNGWAWTYLVVAELIAANEGLGYRILRFYRYKQIPEMYIYLILLGALGLLLDYLFRRMNRRAFAWAESSRS